MAKNGDGNGSNLWSYSAGHPPYTVRVYEREGRSNLYYSIWEDGKEVRRSLKHSDKEKAKEWADDRAPELRKGAAEVGGEKPTVARIFRLYLAERTPDKGDRQQDADKRHAELWRTVLGPTFELPRLSRREWDRFKRQRSTGAINARGETVPETTACPKCEGEGADDCGRCEGTGEIHPRQPVGSRTVEKDLRWLRAVCQWASDYRDDSGRLLLDNDPTRGREIPKEKNPKRPVASDGRIDAIREVYREVKMRVERDGTRHHVESYLPEIFEIVVATGRRITPVCKLRVEDLALGEGQDGAIVWPADTDKMGKEWPCPLSPQAREAVEAALEKRRQHGVIGSGLLFPSAADASKPVTRHTVTPWLKRAEELAGVEPHDGSLWHAYRRRWATVRKHFPDVDTARAGGWASLQALQQSYQHPDEDTMRQVINGGGELREAR